MPHVARIQEFFVEGKNQKKSHVLLHITEPTSAKEWKRGYFFAIAEIKDANIELIGHAQRLIDDIESCYYETEENTDGKGAFETTLEFINRRSNHLLHATEPFHCLVGVIQGTSLSLSYHGTPHAHVFFSQKDGIQDMNILGDVPDEDTQHLFSAVIEGTINPGDRMFFGTPHIINELPMDRIKDIVMSRPLDQAVSHMEQVLKDARQEESYGGLVCDVIEQQADMPTPPSNSAASLQHLIDKQRETTETLSPSLFGSREKTKAEPTRQQKRRNAIETNYRRRSGEEIIGGTLPQIILVSIGRALVATGLFLWKILKWIGVGISRTVIILFILITNKNNGRPHAIRSFKETWLNLKTNINRLSIVSKILFLAVIVLSITFAGSVVYLKIQEHYRQKEIAYEQHVQAIQDKKAAAEARKIYNDDTGAFNLLKEAESLVTTLPQENDEQIKTYEELKRVVDTALLDLRDITIVDAHMIVDLGTKAEGAQASRLTRINDTLVAFGPDDNRYYLVDKDTGSVEVQSHDSLMKLTSGNTPKENDMMVFLGDANQVYVYNPETKAISRTEISFPSESTRIAAPFIYNLRLYLVDKANNQIIRHSKTQTGYDKGTPWLTNNEGVDLSDAVSIAIDGDIFALKQSGAILKFSAGTPESFSISGLDPALENPTDLYTYTDIDSIYIVEPTNKRIVKLNKQGTFQAQYTNDAWVGPTGMVVDVAKKTVYVLDGNKVYSFQI
ncbi:MAG: hypothetical protein UV82_C0015G0022 [Candidatus Magasanikbacteria bacterium GW2011_GWD2_43_18]|nr:MAG: hypothetical protein UV18_C0004G0022 [Candidatus Magasanikbacteria bacterium GW2011_GWC2_42_27]KKT03831.1 MAG: hypothetical protein UV82_C0015G0022 [Candidatus Magasanikbacteria bacterium GW2011_GWD2_43_18]HBB38456.1 hypothetical protein [Candidatus Magasanikbacteria bacterium]HCC14222.1 hypothetical protein [Candidatus Magasanikbacteria bacterium]HCM53844.1 hypothetical protein [Candidatus Magasanikbacteria bacterium]